MRDLTAPMFEYYDSRQQFDKLTDNISIKDPDFEDLSKEIEEEKTSFF